MAKMVTDSQHYADIADAIREKAGTSESLRPADMAAAIAAIPTGGDLFKPFIERILTDIDDSSVTSIGPYACYNYTALKTAIFANLTAMGNNAFQSCTGLTSFSAAKIETLGNYAFAGCSQLRAVTLPRLRAIANYAFQNCSNLATLDLSQITEVGDYGLAGCRALMVGEKLTIPTIKQYGCQQLGQNVSAGFIYEPSEPAVLGNYALSGAKIKEIRGEIKTVGTYALQGLGSAFLAFHGKLTGNVENYGMAGNQYVNDADFSESTIRSIGQYAFQQLGYNRANYSTGPRLTLDFRGCKFPTVNNYSFQQVRYADLYLPSSVTTINQYAFSSCTYINIYMGDSPAPTVMSTNAFNGMSNYKFFVPWNNIASYMDATNWGTVKANLVGYAAAGTFVAGDTLPLYNGEGYSVTWYTDVAMTQAVTVCPDGSPALYCKSGTKDKMVVTVTTNGDITMTATDASGTPLDYATYGYILCDSGDQLTVNATTLDGYVVYIKLDGVKETTVPYTFTVTGDMTLAGTAYDPDSVNPDFTEATWRQIKNAVDKGQAVALYASYLGETKEVELKDGQVLHARLSNCTSDMYAYADGSGTTGLCFDFVELLKDYKRMNPAATNVGGWHESEMRTVTLPAIFDLLPDELQEVIATVITKSCYGGTDGTLVESEDKLFLLAGKEIFGTASSHARTEESAVLTQWQWYAAHNTPNDRIKKNGTSANFWWERSPYLGYAGSFCSVSNEGYTGGNISVYCPYGVSPCFCI